MYAVRLDPGAPMQVRQAGHPPQILQIYSEAIREGAEAAYAAVEQEISSICRTLKCPHPYLGSESLTGAKEVWFFNGYQSGAEQRQVQDAYAANTPLTTALIEASARKAALTEAQTEVFANYRPDLTRGVPWVLGRGRFLVVTLTNSRSVSDGTVFEAPDGMRLIFTEAGSRHDADRAAEAVPEARILAVRPAWSVPAPDWIDADPAFWRSDEPSA